MNAYTRREEARALRATRQQAADLLSRYPHVSEAEAKQIVGFLRTGREVGVVMLSADAALKPKLDRFLADRARHFRPGAVQAVATVAAAVALLALCWLVWTAF
jgi:hypothetical protein